MIDINRIRNNKEEVEKALLKRMDNVDLDAVLEWDKEKRKIGTLMDENGYISDENLMKLEKIVDVLIGFDKNENDKLKSQKDENE